YSPCVYLAPPLARPSPNPRASLGPGPAPRPAPPSAVSGAASRARVGRGNMEALLRRELGCESVKATGHSGGGCISQGQSYDTDRGRVFVKVNGKAEARRMFEGEMASLTAILETGTVRAPKPMAVLSTPGGGSALVMEHLDMRSLNRHAAQLGGQLADLHLDNKKLGEALQQGASTVGHGGGQAERAFVDRFGFGVATCCGYLPQVNDWQEDWVAFYARQRIQPQMDMVEKGSGDREALELWAALQLKIPSLFRGLDIVPALLHGDLWAGNVAEDTSGPVIFDPASFYGHSEYELAIAGMFGGFSSSFYAAYHARIPKAPGFEKRLQLYQLFHYLNHWNHFGSGYRGSSLNIMRNLLRTATLRAFGSPAAGCISEGRAYDTDNGPVFVKVNHRAQACCKGGKGGTSVGPSIRATWHPLWALGHSLPTEVLLGCSSRDCLHQARQMFEGEMASLEALRSTGLVRAPRPIKLIDLPGGGAAFVMEHLRMRSLSSQAAVLGGQMADLHLHNQRLGQKLAETAGTVARPRQEHQPLVSAGRSAEPQHVTKFGFHTGTCCGFIPQVNEWQDDWATFFTRHRLQAQLDLIEKDYGDREARELWSRLQGRACAPTAPQLKIPQLFCGLEIVPALLHGDLWSGNVAEDDAGPVIYDPASFYGHAEFELAIARMFGGFPRSFFTAYHQKIPKAPGFDQRQLLYQLFNYLNHWNHFGPSYRGPALGAMRKLLK
ncbi:Ketosamine-3-kinase, partial [Galemys pyrenaicus]